MRLIKFCTANISKTIYFITCMQSFERKQRRTYEMYDHFLENGFFSSGKTTTPLRIQDFESDSSSEEDPPYLISDSTTTESDWEVSE